MKSTALLLGVTAALVLSGTAQGQDATAGGLELIGEIVLPTGLKIGGEEFGGISGLDYDAATNTYYAISDDRSQRAPARFYTLALDIDAEGLHAVDILRSHLLRDASGNVYPSNGIDPEAIRFDAARRTVFWSSESDVSGFPGVYESGLDGILRRAFTLPAAYLPVGDGAAGIYSNLGFEGLTLSADGTTLFAATENALAQDGAKATLEAGSPARIIAFDVATDVSTVEYVYVTDPIFTPATAEPNYNDNGLSDLLTLDEGRFLAVERSFASGVGNQVKLYVVSMDGATDVAGEVSIGNAAVVPVGKKLLATLGEGDFGLDIDNIEAITFGPEIDGGKTLVIASDNNFNPDGQFTQFVAFKLTLE